MESSMNVELVAAAKPVGPPAHKDFECIACFGMVTPEHLVLLWIVAGLGTLAYFAVELYRKQQKAKGNSTWKKWITQRVQKWIGTGNDSGSFKKVVPIQTRGRSLEGVALLEDEESGLLEPDILNDVQVPCEQMAKVCAQYNISRGVEAASLAVLLVMKRRRSFGNVTTAVVPKQGTALEFPMEVTLPRMSFAELLAETDKALQQMGQSAAATVEHPDVLFLWDQWSEHDLTPGKWMLKIEEHDRLSVMSHLPEEVHSFQILFEACSASPHLNVWEMPVISESCSNMMLALGQPAKDFAKYRDASDGKLIPVTNLLAGPFASPKADAVAGDGFCISYEELVKRAVAVQSAVMAAASEKKSKTACIFMPRGEAIAAAFLGVLRAGFQAVPVDVHWPGERAHAVVQDSNAAVVLVDPSSSAAWNAFGINLPVVLVETALFEQDRQSCTDLVPVDQTDPAIVLFTSGSTGRPKGIVLSHGYLTSLSAGVGEWKRMTATTRTLCYQSPTWMPFIDYLFAPLINGGCCLYFPDGPSHVIKPNELNTFAGKHGATSSGFVPAMLDILLEEGLPRSMTDIGVGGAAVPSELCLRAIAALPDNGALYTGYSGTEVGDVTAIQMTTTAHVHGFSTEQDMMSAGRPHSGQRCAVLDEAFSPVGPGAVGEVCVAGPGLASEYLNLPEKTAETFITSVKALGGARTARSGDLAVWNNNSLQIVGRRDAMVKVRGARVEIGEVETSVLSHPAVKAAVVTVFEDKLVAYVEPAVPSNIREHCAEHLVAYMVPHIFQGLEELPRLPNGKVNKKALPAPEVRSDGTETVMDLDSLGQMRKFTRRAASEDRVLDNARAILIGIVMQSHGIRLMPTGAAMMTFQGVPLYANWGPAQNMIFRLLRGGGWSALAFLSGFDDTRSMKPYGFTYREPLFLIMWVGLGFNWTMWYLPAFVLMRVIFCGAHAIGLEKTHLALASQLWLIFPAFMDLYIGWKPEGGGHLPSSVPAECPSGCFCPWQSVPWSQPVAEYTLGWWDFGNDPFGNSFLGHGLIFIPCYWIGFYFGGSIMKCLMRIAEDEDVVKRIFVAGTVFGIYCLMFSWGHPLLADYKDSCTAFWGHHGFRWEQLVHNVTYYAMNLSMSMLYVVFIAAAVPVHLKFLAKVCFSALIVSGFLGCTLDSPTMALVLRHWLPSFISPGIEVAWTLIVAFLFEFLVGGACAWILPKVAKPFMGCASALKK
eukprot:gnl/TRDRNA2_/TRDRNA2_186427_c0_seq1.p1 gnl/TRDRNA2_/TRDRNA2_186427_c0~~gnl/TRDRNA2_/TRDRNA2_186427_c0_seq1.p1  ORF type:complete len:1219 (-),score=229.93 gnl/TRDRNA2_/TRDRNA2_186427_c0_seq1:255-3911(-)